MESLITTLRTRDVDIPCVVDMNSLITVLEDINAMVGLEVFKTKVAQQVKSFIVNHKMTGNYLAGNMLNVLITGPPGSGKTQCGRMLSRVWSCFSRHRDRIGIIPEKGSVKLSGFKQEDNFVVLTRADLIRKYQGHSVDNIRNIMKTHIGKTIFIDEAYTLCIDSKDTFGMEVATEINNFMDKHPDDIRWIFAGYKDRIEKTLFTLQPGFRRRFSAKFELGNYTVNELFEIFKMQLSKLDLTLEDVELGFAKFKEIHERNGFPDYGGSTLNLSYAIKENMLSLQFDAIMLGDDVSNRVPISMIVMEEKSEDDTSYMRMYM